MKNLIFWMVLLLPLSSFAEVCGESGNVYDDLSCTDRNLAQIKKDLNIIYQKIYSSTQYKDELEKSQKAWLIYRTRQCNGYVAAEASQSQGAGSGFLTKHCLVTITRQRVDYLKMLIDQ